MHCHSHKRRPTVLLALRPSPQQRLCIQGQCTTLAACYRPRNCAERIHGILRRVSHRRRRAQAWWAPRLYILVLGSVNRGMLVQIRRRSARSLANRCGNSSACTGQQPCLARGRSRSRLYIFLRCSWVPALR